MFQHSVLVLLLLISHIGFCQTYVVPIETESGMYALSANNKITKIESVHFSMYFRESQDKLVLNECYYKIRIGNNIACDITLKESTDSILISSRLRYIDQEDKHYSKAEFVSTSYKNAEFISVQNNSITRINYYETIPVYLLIDFPIVYRNKNYFLHLKPDFISE
jgi:hypothetical protein